MVHLVTSLSLITLAYVVWVIGVKGHDEIVALIVRRSDARA